MGSTWRVLPWRRGAAPGEPGGPLWFPRALQGSGRRDRPELYGCLYVSETPLAAVAEALAPFRGTTTLRPAMLERSGLPLALAELSLAANAEILDLDDPHVLVRERLRPSLVATGERGVTQAMAARLFAEHPEAAGLRWWSVLESTWAHLTLFDRAAGLLEVADVQPLASGSEMVGRAAAVLGLATGE